MGMNYADTPNDIEENVTKIEESDTQYSVQKNIDILRVMDIIPSPYQSRRTIRQGELDELKESIRRIGVKQPILVRPLEDFSSDLRYELIAGERRWRASILAGINTIPAIVENNITEEEAFLINLTENIQRAELSAIDEAAAYEKMASQFGYTHEKIALSVCKARSHITNMIRVLSLPEEVIDLISGEKITIGHAKLLVNKDKCIEYAKIASEKGLSVKALENLIKKPDSESNKGEDELLVEEEMKKVTQNLSLKLGIDVKVFGDKITLKYRNLPQLMTILDKLNA